MRKGFGRTVSPCNYISGDRQKHKNSVCITLKYREKSENRKTPETSEQEINGVRVVKNTNENRLQLFFDGKPNAEMITKLKGAAFRWSPRNKAWQRVLTDNAVAAANRILAQ